MPDVKAAQTPLSPLYLRDEELKEGVELLFRAFLQIFGSHSTEPETELGRAHRRALYVIGRHPGITVAGLLAILKITKQSLNRVLNELLEAEYVERRTSSEDGRMRQLRLTPKGVQLETALWEAQRPLLVQAFKEAGPEAVAGFRRVLNGLAAQNSPARKAKVSA